MPPTEVFVNLPYNSAKNHGNKYVIRAQTTKAGSNAPEAGRKLIWTLEADPGNTDRKYLSTKQRARLEKADTTSGPDGWAQNTLWLPHVGGDKYKVKVHRDGDPASSAKVVADLVTWRKIFYTVHYVNNTGKAIYGKVKKRMDDGLVPGFVKLEPVNVAPTPEVQEDTVATSNDLQHLYKGSYPLSEKPWHLRIVIVKKLVDAQTGTMTINPMRSTTNTTECVVSGSAGSYQAVITTPDDLLGDAPVNSISAATYALSGGAWKQLGDSIDLAKSTKKTGDKELTIDLAAHAVKIDGALEGYPNAKVMNESTGAFSPKYQDGAVILTIRYNKAGAGDEYNGHSFGNFVCVKTERKKPDGSAMTQEEIATAVLGTFVHEIGHGLQQAVKEEQLYDGAGDKVTGANALEKNYTESGGVNQGPWHTDDQGGQGPHCATNAKLWNDGTKDVWVWDSTKPKLCTMYFAGDPNRNHGVFCAKCVPRLKRADLSLLNMNKQRWDLY